MMRKYIVTYMRESYHSTVIEANNMDEAQDKAWDVQIKDLEHDYDSGVFKIDSVRLQIGM
jgi:hypothetical protein